MLIHGWGRFPRLDARLLEPGSADSARAMLLDDSLGACIARGSGLSYGDSALASSVISSLGLRHVHELDPVGSVLRCSAGLNLRDILCEVVPEGWILPVVPGTALVSVGGAVAADIHGKNHHRHGSFCEHVRELTLMLADGEVVRCGPELRPDLFQATCGGMGLTGIILEAELQLAPITSSMMSGTSLPATCLEECFELLEAHEQAHYSVAWLDCLKRGPNLGRGMIFLAEHEIEGELHYRGKREIGIPFATPGSLLNRYSLSLFNSAYFHWQNFRAGKSRPSLDAYFFPLDRIRNWNRLYGAAGFLQYQFVLPLDTAREGVAQVLREVSDAGKGSFLSVLKKMGPANGNLLSFPVSGYTLALDFRREASLFPLLEQLDAIVLDLGGRIYLAKDARMRDSVFKQGYPDWERFLAIKHEVDPGMRFRSAQSDRIGLTGPRA